MLCLKKELQKFSMSNSRIAIFPGSFDPFTKGHYDIVLRSRLLFDKLIIGLGNNPDKKRFFCVNLMREKIAVAFKDFENVEVEIYDNLTATFARNHAAQFIIRGLRNTTDFEYENTISQVNRYIYENFGNHFYDLRPPEYAYISSSIVRELYRFGQSVDKFLPYKLN